MPDINDKVNEYFNKIQRESKIERLKNKRYKNKNRYVNALLESYLKALESESNTKEDKYFHKYEVYEALDQIDCDIKHKDPLCSNVEYLIEELNNNIKIIENYDALYQYSIKLNEIKDMIEQLEDMQEFIQYGELETALEINNEIIKKYFDDKEESYREKDKNKYRDNKAKNFTKRKEREEEYLMWLNSYKYRTKKITKSDIAKIMGVSKAAVTQFCKRHGIP